MSLSVQVICRDHPRHAKYRICPPVSKGLCVGKRQFLAVPHEPESLLFALFGKHLQKVQELAVGFFGHLLVCGTFREVEQRGFLCVVFLVVRLGGGDAVAEHFLDVAVGHVHRHYFLCRHLVVVPEFKMVLVAPLVVHPGEAHSRIAAFPVVRGFLAGVVLCTRDELGGGILGKVVEQTLEPDARLETQPHDFVAVLCDGDEVPNRVKFHGLNDRKIWR